MYLYMDIKWGVLMAGKDIKFVFGALEKVDSALEQGTIDAYDILLLSDSNGEHRIGWIDKYGRKILVESTNKYREITVEEIKSLFSESNLN